MNQNLLAFLSLKGVNDYLKHGLVPHAGVAFIVMANIIQNKSGQL